MIFPLINKYEAIPSFSCLHNSSWYGYAIHTLKAFLALVTIIQKYFEIIMLKLWFSTIDNVAPSGDIEQCLEAFLAVTREVSVESRDALNYPTMHRRPHHR